MPAPKKTACALCSQRIPTNVRPETQICVCPSSNNNPPPVPIVTRQFARMRAENESRTHFLFPTTMSLLLRRAATLQRAFSTTACVSNKASKSRTVPSKLAPKKAKPIVSDRSSSSGLVSARLAIIDAARNTPGAKSASEEKGSESGLLIMKGKTKEQARKEAVRGTGVGASERLYAEPEVVGRDPPPPADIQQPLEAIPISSPSSPSPSPTLDAPSPAPTSESFNATQGEQLYSEPETIYTSPPPYNVSLVLAATFVAAVFCLNAADMARVGYSSQDKVTGEYQLAPAWQRYLFAIGFGAVGAGVVSWGVLAPARVVTKINVRRAAGTPRSIKYSPETLVQIYTPLSKLPFNSPRQVPLSSILLLGPLSLTQKSYHPRDVQVPQSNGPIRRLLRPLSDLLIAPPSAKSKRTHWDKQKDGVPLPSNVPILLKGDRATYTLTVKRGPAGTMGDEKGAWCEDWDALEKGLLGVRDR